ncbi:S-formylglutathione hydrolase [Oceanicoccus sp. KOV_DT_Chl]|uniref:S-formylglutathione hydrolase n=1 Tax=Oceanicoccus sp. KOV_DT_Chl TaxID=1904639 RepID=UPI00190EF6D0|nr:S-formylglutathione hydrolase [Oceanicoccus sp. KOV_DT_Chl]
MKEIASNKVSGGWQKRYQHTSEVLACDMVFSVYLPPQAATQKVPVLYWLSGLTCNDQNFVTKAGAQRYAAEYGVAIIAPDTSPRGESVADDDAWDFAQGAGFYLNATQSPWSDNFRMYDYIVEELPALINRTQPVDSARCGIFGHSMGGHGALTIALKNPDKYRSVSAFSPICAPMQCAWGEKAFSQYLGSDRELWRQYDSCELISKATQKIPLLVDQGGDDEFLEQQLKPEVLQLVCAEHNHPLTLRMKTGYDHSYYFISSFIGDHIKHHAEALSL